MTRSYPLISADSHLQVASEHWTGRVPAQYRYIAPRTVRIADGQDATVIGDSKPQIFHGGFTGLPYENRSPNQGLFETTPGGGGPEQRLREQDLDGVDAEIMYTFFGGADTYKAVKDKDPAAYKAVLHAWNEFLGEEYCPVAPDRLMGMGLIPDTGVDDGIAEMEYCARIGLKGVCLTRYPSGKEFPTPEDDRFWAASLDLNMPLTAHMGFAGSLYGRPPFPLPYDVNEVAGGVDPYSRFIRYGFRGAGNAVQMIFDGLFDRFPKLRFYFAETMVGWLPEFYEDLDDQYRRHIPWAARILGVRKLDRLPSEYVREHFWWGVLRSPLGVRLRHEIGMDRIMWGSDFPHVESDWPESQDVLAEMFDGVPEDDRMQMISGNVIEYFHLDAGATLAQKESSTAAVSS